MQISSFNGGLNKRVSPYLMQSNEGVKYSNIDTTTGALAPLKENKDLNAKIKPSFTYFNGHWINSDENRDYVKFQDKIFYSNGKTRPQWSPDGFTWYGVGVDKPSNAPIITSIESQISQDSWVINKGAFEHGYNFFDSSPSDYPIFSNSSTPYELIFKIPVTVNGLTKTLYHKWNFTLNRRAGGIFRCVEQVTPHIKTPSVPFYYKYNTGYFIYGATGFRQSIWKTQNTSERLDTTNLQIQQAGKITLNLVIFKKDKSSNVFNKVETKTLQTELTTKFSQTTGSDGQWLISEFIDNISLTLSEELDDLKIFLNGYSVTTIKNSSNPLNWFIVLDKQGVSIDEFLSNNTINSISYCYTYTTSEGVESRPSEVYAFPILLAPTYVEVTASSDPQVTGINIYRLGGALTQYSLIAKLPNETQTFSDTLGDSEIDGAVLTSYNNLPAPDMLRYLTLYNTMLFGSIDDKLYYTDVASPFVWSGFNFIDCDDTITGIGGTPNGLLVFTKHSTYIVTGTSPDTFSKYLLSSGVGCVLHKSIQSLQNTLLWLSEDSICTSNGGSIQILSRDKLDVIDFSTPRCSAVLNDVYYLSHNNGTLIADFRFGLVFRESDKVYYGLAVKDNSLYGVEVDDTFVEVNKGDKPLSITYTSPKFSDGSISTIKTYKDIYFHSTGDLSVKVYIDDTLVGSKSLAKGFDEIKVSSNNTRGYSIQFEVSGTGTLNEIEYKVESRQNGR